MIIIVSSQGNRSSNTYSETSDNGPSETWTSIQWMNSMRQIDFTIAVKQDQ